MSKNCPHCGTNIKSAGLTGPAMAKQIETKILKLFPDAFLQCKFGTLSGPSPFILIQFGIDGKESKKNSTAIYSDPYHMQMFVRGFQEDGTPDAEQTLGMSINKAARHIGAFDTDKVGSANQIINHIVAYFKKLKQYVDQQAKK